MHFDETLAKELCANAEVQGRMPDLVVYFEKRNQLFLVETIKCDGPISPERRSELGMMFRNCKAGLVFVTAFTNRKAMTKYLGEIAWGTVAWAADSPAHLIHFDGSTLTGPYAQQETERPVNTRVDSRDH
jgi:hypothetical protein